MFTHFVEHFWKSWFLSGGSILGLTWRMSLVGIKCCIKTCWTCSCLTSMCLNWGQDIHSCAGWLIYWPITCIMHVCALPALCAVGVLKVALLPVCLDATFIWQFWVFKHSSLFDACYFLHSEPLGVFAAVAPICYAHLAATQVSQFIKFDDSSDTSSGHGAVTAAGPIPVPELPKLHENVCSSMFFCWFGRGRGDVACRPGLGGGVFLFEC